MFATPFVKEEYTPADDSGLNAVDGYKEFETTTEKKPLSDLPNTLHSLKPYDFYRLGQLNNFYSPMRTVKEESKGVPIEEDTLYKQVATRFNGSQYGYRSTAGYNERGSTWLSVSNIAKAMEEKQSELDEDTINMIAQSSLSGYQQPKEGMMDAEDRILAKSNDVIPATFLRDARRNQVIDPAGRQGIRL